MTTTELTATQIVHGVTGATRFENGDGFGHPMHPALAILGWDDDRTDVHGIANKTSGREAYDGPVLARFDCHCGFETRKHEGDAEATAELADHALRTCAVCRGPKPSGNFPRCSNCAF